MPVLGAIVASPIVAGIAAVAAAQQPPQDPAAACQPRIVVRLESANLAARPAPDPAACKAAEATSRTPGKDPVKTDKAP